MFYEHNSQVGVSFHLKKLASTKLVGSSPDCRSYVDPESCVTDDNTIQEISHGICSLILEHPYTKLLLVV